MTIPGSVTFIGEWAFSDCSKLTSVKFNGKKEPKDVDIYAFHFSNNLKRINVPDDYEGYTFCGVSVVKGDNPTTDPTTSSPKSSKLSGGAIAGIVIGGIVGVAVITIVIVLFIKHHQDNTTPENEEQVVTVV